MLCLYTTGTWPGGSSWWDPLQKAGSSLTIPWTGSYIRLQPSDICWISSTARHRRSRQFLQCADYNFLMHVMEKPMRRGVLIGLDFINSEELVRDAKIGGSLWYSDYGMVKSKVLYGRRKISSFSTLDYRRANFDLFKDRECWESEDSKCLLCFTLNC